MSIISTDGFTFDFPKAKEVYEFDSDNKSDLHYHGFTEMKAVDVMAELDNAYLFIEVKDFFNPLLKIVTAPDPDLKEALKYKYRDSYLFQLAHGKVDKPIYYICVMEHLDSAMMMQLASNLGKVIPDSSHQPVGWTKPFLEAAIVVDKATWNATLSKWGSVM